MIVTINIYAYILKIRKEYVNVETVIVLLKKKKKQTWIRFDSSYFISQTFHSFNFEKANTVLLK